jgi:putative cardiolipin synthase
MYSQNAISSYQMLLILIFLMSCNSQKPEEPMTDFCSRIHRNDTISLSGQLEGLEDSLLNKTGAYVLEDGAGSMVARAWLSEYAEETIDIQYFIFSTDNVGLIACDYLVRAADRGVKVRMIVDDIMVDAPLSDVLKLDSHENIQIKIYNPGVNLGKNLVEKASAFLTDFRSANQRMHNKTFNVDGRVVITGGRNIADEYFDYDHEYNFRDRDVLLLGKATQDVADSFTQFWESPLSVPVSELSDEQVEVEENDFERLHEYACNPENFWPQVRTRLENLPSVFEELVQKNQLVWLDDVKFVSDEPGKNDGTSGLGGGGETTNALIELIKNAEKSIDIQTPYLITTELSQDLFREAVDRGVQVRILTNSLASTDNVEAFSSYQSDRETLLATGVRIFEFRPDAAVRMELITGELSATLEEPPVFGLHAKSMVVDGRTTVIGTFNLDPRSANLNTECITILQSEQVAAGVLSRMEEEFNQENAWETTIDFNPDSEVGNWKRVKTWTRKALPKAIL